MVFTGKVTSATLTGPVTPPEVEKFMVRLDIVNNPKIRELLITVEANSPEMAVLSAGAVVSVTIE